MSASFEKNVLTLGGKQILLETEIFSVESIGGTHLVLFDDETYPENDPNSQRNLIALNDTGQQLWRIELTPSAPIEDGKRQWNGYVGIDPNLKPVKVLAYDMSGLCWELDIQTGKVSNP